MGIKTPSAEGSTLVPGLTDEGLEGFSFMPEGCYFKKLYGGLSVPLEGRFY